MRFDELRKLFQQHGKIRDMQWRSATRRAYVHYETVFPSSPFSGHRYPMEGRHNYSYVYVSNAFYSRYRLYSVLCSELRAL